MHNENAAQADGPAGVGRAEDRSWEGIFKTKTRDE